MLIEMELKIQIVTVKLKRIYNWCNKKLFSTQHISNGPRKPLGIRQVQVIKFKKAKKTWHMDEKKTKKHINHTQTISLWLNINHQRLDLVKLHPSSPSSSIHCKEYAVFSVRNLDGHKMKIT